MEREKLYCIIKVITLINGQKANVIILDSSAEVLEFTDKDKAQEMAEIMERNSDSGWEYIVKEI